MSIKNFFWVCCFSFLSACVTDADRRREVEARRIKLILYEYPQCNYRLVGAITTGVEKTENSAILEAKKEAVDLGAEYLSIMSIAKYAMDATSVSGKAFVCSASSNAP